MALLLLKQLWKKHLTKSTAGPSTAVRTLTRHTLVKAAMRILEANSTFSKASRLPYKAFSTFVRIV